MKVAFVADTHFGYPRFEKDAHRQGREALLDAARKADAILLGGDIFDTRLPKLETLAEAAQALIEAGEILKGKSGGAILAPNLIIGIHGTHERRGKDALNPIQMMARLGLLEDVHNRTVVLEKKGDAKKTAISGMGGLPDDLVSQALKQLSCKPVDGAVNIFMFHQTMAEFVPQSPNLASIEELPEGYDWKLCGHMHTRKEYSGGRLLIPGSTVITQLREEDGEQKGYFIIDTEAAKAEFVPLQTRKFLMREIAIDGHKPSQARIMVEDEIAKIAREIGSHEKPIVRVKVSGKLADGAGELDLAGLGHESIELYVDSTIAGGGLAAEIGQLKEMRANKASPLELGRARLRENAKKAGMAPERADELFLKFSKQ